MNAQIKRDATQIMDRIDEWMIEFGVFRLSSAKIAIAGIDRKKRNVKNCNAPFILYLQELSF